MVRLYLWQKKLGRLGALHVCTTILRSGRRLVVPDDTDAAKLGREEGVERRGKDDRDGDRGGSVREQFIQLAVQVTGALRNLCMEQVGVWRSIGSGTYVPFQALRGCAIIRHV
jgi:hypothetical protein